MKIMKYIIKYFRCCLERIKFYFVKSYSSYTSVTTEGRKLNEAKSKLTAETEVGEHPDHLHWTPSILWQTDSFLPLYDTSGNLNVPTCLFITGVSGNDVETIV